MAREPELIDGVPSFTVSTFNGTMKVVLKDIFPDGVWIEGEIEGMKAQPHASGHYFSLVDNDGKNKAKIDVKLFAASGDLRRVMSKMSQNGVDMANGLRVRFLCQVDFYVQRGEVSLIIKDVDTQFTLGDIAATRDELIRQLTEAGVHKRNKSVPVPLVPLRLGIVSSSQAAGYIDALTHLRESGIGFHVTLIDVNVMGDLAVDQIVAAVSTFSRRDDVDVVMVMRGGGSKGDLATFDDKRIALAIADCPHPVFTGIGHEIDTSIADLMAHTQCKTPTACADEVISIVADFMADVVDAAGMLRSRTHTAVARARSRLRVSSERLRVRPRTALERASQKMAMYSTTVNLLDPVTTLARGWSITRDSAGNVVRSVAQVTAGDILTTSVVDGTVVSTVDRIEGTS